MKEKKYSRRGYGMSEESSIYSLHVLSQLSSFLFYLSQKRTWWSEIFSGNCCTEGLQHPCKAVTVISGYLNMLPGV